MPSNTRLPTFVRPMLARGGCPFDSDRHLFEIKWDGIRALAYVEADGYRLVSRQGLTLHQSFPELAHIGDLPPGTVLDGELVVLRDGRPELALVQGRQQLGSTLQIQIRAQTTPATYVVFDQLYHEHRPLLAAPLAERRDMLRSTLERTGHSRLVFSKGILRNGRTLFQQVVDQKLEGVVAKRLDSPYQPGRRSGAWIKIKPTRSPTSCRSGGRRSLKV